MYVLYNQADLHLDTFPWARRPEFKGDSFDALVSSQEVILNDPITTNDKKVVIWSGDITEKSYIDDATNACMAKVVRRYIDQGVQLLYVNGNHDKSKHGFEDSCGHAGIYGARHIGNGEPVKIGPWTIVGLDWMPRSDLQAKIGSMQECDILAIHCAFQHLLGFAGAYDLTLEDIPASVKHSVLVGDVHVTDARKNSRGTWVVSPGPLHPCSISQPGPHGVMRLKEGEDEWEFLAHTTRHVLDYTLDEETKPSKMADLIIKEAGAKEKKPHCVIRYRSEDAAIAETVIEKIAAHVHLHEKKTSSGHIMDAAQRQQIIKEIRETSMLEEIKNLPVQTDASKLVEDLLSTDDPGQILEKYVNEVLGETC